jgi:transcriptional regulator with XRE-family HTH domain
MSDTGKKVACSDISKFIRQQCGFRQEDLAVLMSVTPGAVCSWEHGGNPSLEHSDILQRLSEILAAMKPTIGVQAKHAFAAGYLHGRMAQSCQPAAI